MELSDGSRVPAKTVIWTAGTSANALIAALPRKLDRGRIVTDQYLQVRDWPGVWALGDCASVTDRNTGRPYPPTVQHALRQGKTVAKNILAAICGGTKKPFSFSTLGLLASIGRRTGVANIFGINFAGFAAWFLWRTVYLSKLPRLEKKVRVALDWTLDLLFSKDLVHLLNLRTPTVSDIDEEADTALVGVRPLVAGHVIGHPIQFPRSWRAEERKGGCVPKPTLTAGVIESGPNGLSATIVLAAPGNATTVFERNLQIGGACFTAETTPPKFRQNLGASA